MLPRVIFWFFCFGVISVFVKFVLSQPKKHDFTGRCQVCHTAIPLEGASFKESQLIDNVDKMCAPCHVIDEKTSHPTGVMLEKSTPLNR